MNRKTLNTIIPIVSVGVMVVWGTIAKSYEHTITSAASRHRKDRGEPTRSRSH